MKRILITYHMHKAGETAESCINLLMEDSIADDLLLREDAASTMTPGHGNVWTILDRVCRLQGYIFDGAVMFERAALSL